MTNEEKRNIYNNIQNLYNMDFTTWQEVLAMLYNLVADVEQKFEAFEQKFELMLGKEVTEAIKKMYEDGTLAEMINKEIFADLNNKIDEIEADILMTLTDYMEENNKKIETFNEQLDNIENIINCKTIDIELLKTNKVLNLDSGTYLIEGNLLIPSLCTLNMKKDTILQFKNNTDGLIVEWGGNVNGGVIKTPPNYQGSALKIISINNWSANDLKRTSVTNTVLQGDESSLGNGILLDDSLNVDLSYLFIENISIRWYTNGLITNGSVTACNINNLEFFACMNNLVLNKGFDGNSLKNIQIQARRDLKSALICNQASYNNIEIMVWDVQSSVNYPLITINENCYRTMIINKSGVSVENKGKLCDVFSDFDNVQRKPMRKKQIDLRNLEKTKAYPVCFKRIADFLMWRRNAGGSGPFNLKLFAVGNAWDELSRVYNITIGQHSLFPICTRIYSTDQTQYIAVYLKGGYLYDYIDNTDSNFENPVIVTDSLTDGNFTVSPMTIVKGEIIPNGVYWGATAYDINKNSTPK